MGKVTVKGVKKVAKEIKGVASPRVKEVVLAAGDGVLTIKGVCSIGSALYGFCYDIPAEGELESVLLKGTVWSGEKDDVKELFDFLSNADEAEISVEDYQLKIKTPVAQTVIEAAPPDSMVYLDSVEEAFKLPENMVCLDAGVMNEIISKVVPIAAGDATTSNIEMVNFENDNDKPGVVNVVATDGYRLACLALSGGEISKIIPEHGYFHVVKDMWRFIKKLVPKKGDVYIATTSTEDKDYFYIACDYKFMFIECFAGDYPDWKRVVPREDDFIGSFSVNRKQFLEVLNTAKKLATDKMVPLNIVALGNDKLLIEYKDKFKSELPSRVEGGFKKVILNAPLLLDFFKGMKSDEITLYYVGRLSPLMIKGDNDKNYFGLIMPISDDR